MQCACPQIFIALLGLMVNVLAQAVSFKVFSGKGVGLLRSICLGFAAGLLAVLFIESRIFSGISSDPLDSVGVSAATLIIYGLSGYCYFHFVNMGQTARRIRILRELAESKEGLSLEGILEKYDAKEIVRRRLDRLLATGQIICKDGRYYMGKGAVLWMSRSVSSLKFFLLGNKNVTHKT